MHILKDLKYKTYNIIWIHDPKVATCLLLSDKGGLSCCFAQLI